MTRHSLAVMFVVATVGSAVPAASQSVSLPGRGCGQQTSAPLLSGTFRGITRVPDKTSLAILTLGAAGAFGAHADPTAGRRIGQVALAASVTWPQHARRPPAALFRSS